MKKIAFLASHNGSAARAITAACINGTLTATPSLLVTNNSDSRALIWAQDLNVKSAVINAANTQDVDGAIAGLFEDYGIDLVVCSSYMKLIGPKTIASVGGKILNVHPALLPKFGGKGMYGKHVHQAVFDAKERETGITIHMVDGEYDHGKMVAQKAIPLDEGESAASIEEKVKAAEPNFYIETLQKILNGEIKL